MAVATAERAATAMTAAGWLELTVVSGADPSCAVGGGSRPLRVPAAAAAGRAGLAELAAAVAAGVGRAAADPVLFASQRPLVPTYSLHTTTIQPP